MTTSSYLLRTCPRSCSWPRSRYSAPCRRGPPCPCPSRCRRRIVPCATPCNPSRPSVDPSRRPLPLSIPTNQSNNQSVSQSICRQQTTHEINKHIEPPYSRVKIFAAPTARISRGSSSCRSISPPAPDLSSKPAACRCCCRSTGQTDGRTRDRLLTGARLVRKHAQHTLITYREGFKNLSLCIRKITLNLDQYTQNTYTKHSGFPCEFIPKWYTQIGSTVLAKLTAQL